MDQRLKKMAMQGFVILLLWLFASTESSTGVCQYARAKYQMCEFNSTRTTKYILPPLSKSVCENRCAIADYEDDRCWWYTYEKTYGFLRWQCLLRFGQGPPQCPERAYTSTGGHFFRVRSVSGTSTVQTNTADPSTTDPSNTGTRPTGPSFFTSTNARYTSIPQRPVKSRKRLCSCAGVRNMTSPQSPISDVIEKELSVEVSKLSSRRRRKESAIDSRPSTNQIGYVSVIVLVALFGGILLCDLPKIFRDITVYKKTRRNRQH